MAKDGLVKGLAPLAGATGLFATGQGDKLWPLFGLMGLGEHAAGMNPLSALFGIPGLVYGFMHRDKGSPDKTDPGPVTTPDVNGQG